MRDRVLRDLHGDRLAVAQHALDARALAALDVGRVVHDVAAVQHAVLRRADVDERGFHAGQHVLDATEVDVAVDRQGVVGRHRHVVLDEGAALEHRDVRDAVGALVHDHQVAAGRPALAVRTAAPARASRCRATRAARCRRRRRRPAARPRRRSATAVAACGARSRTGRPRSPAPPLPRPRPPRRRRRFFGASAGTRRGGAECRDGVSPTRGFGGADAAAGRAMPASSRACSPMSSSVRPRSASAAVQSSRTGHRLGCLGGGRATAPAVGFALPPFALPAFRRGAGFLRPRPPRESAAPPLLRGAVGVGRRSATRWSRRAPGADASDFGSALDGVEVVARPLRSAPGGREAAWVIRSVPRTRGDPVRTSMPSLMTRAPPAHAGACRQPAVPAACRRARSIDGSAVPARRPGRPGRRPLVRCRRARRRAWHCGVAW